MPTPMRASASCPYVRTRPDHAVIALQTASPIAMIVRRDRVSATRAMGMPAQV
jgi:hypothetical protein